MSGSRGYGGGGIIPAFPGNVESNGGVSVNIQDQTTPPIDFFFTQIQSAPTTVAIAGVVDGNTIALADATGCLPGDYFGMFNADDPLDNRAYFGSILAINGSVLTLDTPLDYPFKVGDTAACFNRDIDTANGALGSPEIFQVQVGPNATQSIDITRIMISFITDARVDLNKFGDIAGVGGIGLTNGCVLRRINGKTNNIANVKNNAEIANLSFDYTPYDASNPAQGVDGAKFRLTFAGSDKHGVAIRLDPGDAFQIIVQDDLTSLLQFRIIAEGHYVGD